MTPDLIQLGKLHFKGALMVLPEMDRIRVFDDAGQVIAEWLWNYGDWCGADWSPIIITGDVPMEFIHRCMNFANSKRHPE